MATLTRRRLIAASAAVPLAAAAAAAPVLGVQIFVLFDEAMRDLGAALRRIAAAGAREVEMMAGVGGSPVAVAAALQATGLTCRSLHAAPYALVPGLASLQEPDAVIAAARALGAGTVVCTFPLIPPSRRSMFSFTTPDPGAFGRAILSMDDADWARHIAFLNQTGAMLARAGLRLAYHNHAPDFAPAAGGTRYDQVMAQTDPGSVWFELDCGWAQAAGADPVALLRRAPDRFRLLHLKDVAPGQPVSLGGLTRTLLPLGTGIMDWRAILRAARQAGVEAMYVEQDPPYDHPPAEDIASSLHFLRTQLA